MTSLSNFKWSQLALTFALTGILIFMTACPDPPEDFGKLDPPSSHKSTEVKDITRDNGNQEVTFTLERNAAKDQYTSIKDDMGIYAEIVRSGSTVTIKHGNPVPLYEVDLNSDNRITETVYNGGSFRLRNTVMLLDDRITQVNVQNEILQPDSSYSQEPSAELSDIDIDLNGGTMVFTQLISGSPTVFDVEVACLGQVNNLRYNVPFAVMNDFNDTFFNFVNQFDYCISSMNFTNRDDNSTFSLSYQYEFDSQNRVTERSQTSSQQGSNDLTFRVNYYSD